MANGSVHHLAGAIAGGSTAYICADGQLPPDRVVEMVGGALAGYYGSFLPDIIDPPLHPNHRSVGHGVVPIGTVGSWAISNLPAWQSYLREKADGHARARLHSHDDATRLWHAACENFFRLLAGMVAGFIAGYGSHLVLDAITPRSLPLCA